MIVLKQIIHFPDTNSVEATWVDRTVLADVFIPASQSPSIIAPDGAEIPGEITPEQVIPGEVVEVTVKCHSYADVQMSMLRADMAELGGGDYDELIATVEAGIKPVAVVQAPPPDSVSRFQARAALWQMGFLDDVEAYMALDTTDMMAKLAWRDAQDFRIDSVFVLAVAPLLGFSDAHLADMFRFAKTITG